jgi:hypothetical protein
LVFLQNDKIYANEQGFEVHLKIRNTDRPKSKRFTNSKKATHMFSYLRDCKIDTEIASQPKDSFKM